MAKKNLGKTAKKRIKEEVVKKEKRRCFTCDGMGQKCQVCGESESACQCPLEDDGDGKQELEPCEECYGTGIAPLDIEKSDLDPRDVAKWKKDMKEEGK